MFFELHCHSSFSLGRKIPTEGLSPPRDVIRTAKKQGLTGVAITDHDSVESWKEAGAEARKQGIVFIPGCEISSLKGHILGLGLSGPVRPGLSVGETMDRIHEQGGIAVAAHPFDIKGDGIKHDFRRADAVEVFNAVALDRLTNRFCEMKVKKSGKPMVAGSDAHTLKMIGTAPNMINADTVGSVLKKIRNGDVRFLKRYAPARELVYWARERLTRSENDVRAYIQKHYRFPKAPVSRFLLNRFLASKRERPWLYLGRFGMGVSVLYAGARVAGYQLLGK